MVDSTVVAMIISSTMLLDLPWVDFSMHNAGIPATSDGCIYLSHFLNQWSILPGQTSPPLSPSHWGSPLLYSNLLFYYVPLISPFTIQCSIIFCFPSAFNTSPFHIWQNIVFIHILSPSFFLQYFHISHILTHLTGNL
jgi:hypothetical protein